MALVITFFHVGVKYSLCSFLKKNTLKQVESRLVFKFKLVDGKINLYEMNTKKYIKVNLSQKNLHCLQVQLFFPFQACAWTFSQVISLLLLLSHVYIRSNEMMMCEAGLLSATILCKKKALLLSTYGLSSHFLQKTLDDFPYYVSVYFWPDCSFSNLYVTANHLVERTS